MPPVHDYVIDNSTGANVRQDINNALAAIVSNNSSSSQPATRYAYMWWADTTTGILKIRNSANDGWVELLQLDGTLTLEDGSASNPGLAFRNDLDCGIFRPEANALGIATAGATRMEMNTAETNFNDGGSNLNFRIEGNTDTRLFFLDGGTDRIGIGVDTAPLSKLHVQDVEGTTLTLGNTAAAASDGDYLSGIDFHIKDNNDGTGATCASIRTFADQNHTASAKGTALAFFTVDDDTTVLDERLRIDQSGNVGIGITPDAHGSSVTSLQIGGSTNLYDDSNFVILANNVYLDSSGNKRIKADEASRFTQEAGKFFFERAGVDSADSAITFQRIIATNEDGTVFLKGQATNDNNRMQIRVDDTLATVMASSNSGTERNIAFHTRNTSGSLAGTFTANGLAMPSGKGIDFAADGSASGMESELLNDYEEGVFTATNTIGSTLTENFPSRYVKVGNLCYIMMDVSFSGASDVSQTGLIQSLPFTSQDLTNGEQSIGYPFISETSSSARDADESNTVFFVGKNESRVDIFNLSGGHIQTRSFLTGRRFRMNFCYRTA
jgi:hypothetical protein